MKLFFVIFISVVSLLSIAVPAPLTIAATSFPNCSTNWSAYILGNNSNRGFDDYNNTITNGTAASFVQNGTLAANGGWTMPNSGAARKYLYNNDSVTIAYPHLISPFSQDGLSILWWNFSGNASDIKVCIDFYDDGNSQQYYKASFLLLDGANTATQSINLITNDCTTGFYCEQAGSLAARETDIIEACHYWNSSSNKGVVSVRTSAGVSTSSSYSGNPFKAGGKIKLYTNEMAGRWMNFRAWNATIYGEVCPPIPGANSTNPPVLSSFNCTSCDIPNGDNSTPYSTLDTTPAFTFTTDKNAWCRIDDEDLNFTGMGALRNCTSGDGSLAHTCNLLPEDALEYKSTDYLYISCRDSANVESSASSSGPLEMEMINSASQANTAIERGINASNASAAIFNDQQVFIRSLNNSQAMATFDRVAIYKSQKWAFNYISTNETAIGQFYNLSPAFYFWEGMNLSDIQITDQVGKLINKTKI